MFKSSFGTDKIRGVLASSIKIESISSIIQKLKFRCTSSFKLYAEESLKKSKTNSEFVT